MSDAPKFCYLEKTAVPPRGWWIDWNGHSVSGGDWGDLVRKCHAYLLSNGEVPPVDLEKQIEHKLCERLAGHPACGPCNSAAQTIGFSEIVRWVKTMFAFATDKKFELVSQEEANRRASICAACPHQMSTSGCWGCKGIAGMLPTIAGARQTTYDQQLKACGICGCYNAVSVHLPLDIQQDSNLSFPDFCWKASTGSQT